MQEAVHAFKSGFEKGLGIILEPYTLTAEEEKEVQQLAKDRYENDEWNYKR